MKKKALIVILFCNSQLLNGMIIPKIKPHTKIANHAIQKYFTEKNQIYIYNSVENIPEVEKPFDIICNQILIDTTLPKSNRLKLIADQSRRNNISPSNKCALHTLHAILSKSKRTLNDYAISSDYNAFFDDEKTILHIAIEQNNYDLFQTTIKHIPFIFIDKCNKEGNTPLYIAAKQLQLDFVEGLLMRAADENSKNENGKTALISAVQFPTELLSPQKIENLLSITTKLCQHGANVMHRDNNNKTALDYVRETLAHLGYYERRTIYNEHGPIMKTYEELEKILIHPPMARE